MFFTPGTHLQAGLSHNPLKAIVSPRPIGWISSRGNDGSVNLAPYSYFNAIAEQPPMVMFSSAPGGDTGKDSLRNVLETKEFVVNIVSAALGDAMNRTAATAAPDVDEFELAGLDMVEACAVDAPMVAASPANLECRVTQVAYTGRPESRGAVVFGEVVAYHIDESVLDGTYIDQETLDAIGRMGGPRYTHTRSLFGMERPE